MFVHHLAERFTDLQLDDTHRQKEKKDSGYNLASSSSSGSAPDPDHDTADLEGLPFAFSSSPAPARLPQQHQHQQRPDDKENFERLPVASSSPAATSTSALLPAVLAPVTPSLPSHSTRSSTGALPIPTTTATANPYTYTYSYPSSHSVQPPSSIPVYATDLLPGAGGAEQMKARGGPIVAAKKHVRKRPLGSHAPLARRPSLRHAFEFPDSPPKVKKAEEERPKLRRMGSAAGSLGSVGGGSGGEGWLSGGAGEVGEGRARVWVDALARSSSPPITTGLLGSEEDALGSDDPDLPLPLATRAAPSTPTAREIWQHMASDAPSSPPPAGPFSSSISRATLTRKMMLAHAAESSSSSAAFPFASATATLGTGKPALRRTLSLGGTGGSNGGVRRSEVEGSRAGGEEACAVEAFERKRARALGQTGGAGAGVGGGKKRRTTAVAGKPGATRRRSSAPCSSAAAAAEAVREEGEREGSSSSSSSTSEMGDLSFSSTSTTTSTATLPLTPPAGTSLGGGRGFFALTNAVKASAAASAAKKSRGVGQPGGEEEEEENERECAELLLGLGGFF